MSPAKMFAYMKKREGRAGRRVCNITRDLFNGSECAIVWNRLDFTPIFMLLYFLTCAVI